VGFVPFWGAVRTKALWFAIPYKNKEQTKVDSQGPFGYTFGMSELNFASVDPVKPPISGEFLGLRLAFAMRGVILFFAMLNRCKAKILMTTIFAIRQCEGRLGVIFVIFRALGRSIQRPAVATGDPVIAQNIFFPGASANIVDQQRCAEHTGSVGYDPDVRQCAADEAGHNIARAPILGARRQGKLFAMPGQKHLQIGHAAVINVAVCGLQTPFFGVSRKGRFHIGIDQGLQIKAKGIAIGADDDVGAHAFAARHIAIGEGEARIGGVVGGGHTNLLARRRNQGSRAPPGLRKTRRWDYRNRAARDQKLPSINHRAAPKLRA
jgi:hypothetical protein